MSYTVIEDTISESLADYIAELFPTIGFFLLDEDWPRIDGPYIGMQIIETDRTGFSDYKGLDGNGLEIHEVGYTNRVELIAFRDLNGEKPVNILQRVQHLLHDPALTHKYFTSNNIGILDVSSIVKADVVLDGERKELRARMIIDIHTRVQEISTSDSGVIETVNFTISTDRDDNTDDKTGSVTYP